METKRTKTYTEGRASPRFRPRPGSHIVYLEGFGEIKDVSFHGVFVLDADPLPVGTKIKFSFRFGNDDIPVEGVVQRSVEGHGMGIELTETSAESKRRLKQHLAGML